MLSCVSALLLFSINIWTHGSVLTKWKDRAFPRLFQFHKFLTTDNCWRRDTQINTNPGKLWITCLSVHSCVRTINLQHVAPHSPSPPSQGCGKKQRGKEERGEAAKAIFMTVCRSKGNQPPAWQQLTSVFIQFYIPFIMYIEMNLLQRLRVLNRVLAEAPLLKPKIFALLVLEKDKVGCHIFY